MDARIWKSESDGQHPDPDVQRQLWADIDAKLRAMVKRGERRSMTASWSGEVEGIYRMNPTICREVRGEPWGDEYMLEIISRSVELDVSGSLGGFIAVQSGSTVFCVILTVVC